VYGYKQAAEFQSILRKGYLMQILILGAGGIGGYFGARLQEAGGNVTFLVRPDRAVRLRTEGLRVLSPLGNAHITPHIVSYIESGQTYDVIILSCKAYDLDSAIEAVAPAVGPESMLVPLLNGLAHLDVLDFHFGCSTVQGCLAHLAVTLLKTGEIRHLNQLNRLVIGSRSLKKSKWLEPFAHLLSEASVECLISDNIEQDMWDKFVFISTFAAATCTMRASIGDILATSNGKDFLSGLLLECVSVAETYQHAPDGGQMMDYRSFLLEPGSLATASMLRDIENGGRTEGEHVLGDIVSRGTKKGLDLPLLTLAYNHLQAYELRRLRNLELSQ
jgi:2-dehydropantoate 2-reductase